MEARGKYESLWALLYVAFVPCAVLSWSSYNRPPYEFMTWVAATFAFLLLSFGICSIHQRFLLWFFWGYSIHLYGLMQKHTYYVDNPFRNGDISELLLIELTIIVLSVAFLFGGTKNRALFWLLVSSAIAAFLARSGSSEFGAGGMIDWFAQFGISPEIAENLTIVFRKTVHMTFFGSIAATAWLALRTHGDAKVQLIWPLAWTLLHASFDEYRQSLTPNRTGTIADVAIDLLGAGAAIWFLHSYTKRKESGHESSQPPTA
jgi:VanZ family protein